MHFLASQTRPLNSKLFPTSFHASDRASKVKGVAILIHKNCPFRVDKVQRDPAGQYIFVKGTWKGVSVTLAKVYSPNVKQLSFLDHMLTQLHTFGQGMIILGGDLNIALNPSLDTSGGKPACTYRVLRRIKTALG